MHVAKDLFHAMYHGNPNFMTPHVIWTRMIAPNVACELSSGAGIESDHLYGITLVAIVNNNILPGRWLSHAFNTYRQATAYASKLHSAGLPRDVIPGWLK